MGGASLAICLLLSAWTSDANIPSPAAAAEDDKRPLAEMIDRPVVVELGSGRVIVGTLDEKSDDQWLWLRRETPRVKLSSGFPMIRVVRCQLADTDDWSTFDDSPDETLPTEPCSTGQYAGFLDDPYRDVPELAAIEVWSEAVNFDGDVENDGLRVRVRPVDRYGQTAAWAGNLQFILLGEHSDWRTGRHDIWRGGGHDLRRPRFLELERWSAQLSPEQISTDGAVFNLEFRTFHPERQLDIANDALLNVRLSVPGRGVFAASDDRLILRPWSAIRDSLQQGTDSRFFWQERSWIRTQR